MLNPAFALNDIRLTVFLKFISFRAVERYDPLINLHLLWQKIDAASKRLHHSQRTMRRYRIRQTG